ncbi:hypothetical protein Tco_0110970 [Tanacetum coccineum]
MVKMVTYEAFACPCGDGDVVLRESYKPKTCDPQISPLPAYLHLQSRLIVSEAHQTAPTDLEDEDIDRCVRPSPQGMDGKSKKRKRSKSDKFAHMYSESHTMLNNSITTMGNEMNMNLSKMANDNERKLESEIELMKKVQNEIDALPGITFEEDFEATDVIWKCPLKAEMLFRYDQGEKIRMVKMVARKSTS